MVYSGEPQLCRPFLAKSFPIEESKVGFVITMLSGRAVWEQGHPCCASFQSFNVELKKVFDRSVSGRKAARTLVDLRQGESRIFFFVGKDGSQQPCIDY